MHITISRRCFGLDFLTRELPFAVKLGTLSAHTGYGFGEKQYYTSFREKLARAYNETNETLYSLYFVVLMRPRGLINLP
jgi:hypothetical protein